MEELTLTVPGMWADHHVLAVRDLLTRLPGVADVAASALDRSVRVTFETSEVDAAVIAGKLEAAGYAAGSMATPEAPPTDKPAWAGAGLRTTATDPADLAMSGDHRKY